MEYIKKISITEIFFCFYILINKKYSDILIITRSSYETHFFFHYQYFILSNAV